MKENTLFTTTDVTDSNRILHTPGSFAKENLLYVQEVGELKSLKSHKSQRENLDSYLFMAVLNGEGKITIKDKELGVIKGDCLLINCRESYSHESSDGNPWELCWVHFNGKLALPYFELFINQNEGSNLFRPQTLKFIKNIIENLMNHQAEKKMESELLSGELLLKLLNFCATTVMKRGMDRQGDTKTFSKAVREYINNHYQNADLLSDLSDKFEMNEEQLDMNFYKIYGIRLIDYILNRRFTAAKELLRFTIIPINEVIKASGIGNDELFQKTFRNSENMTAEEYRMKWSQWVK